MGKTSAQRPLKFNNINGTYIVEGFIIVNISDPIRHKFGRRRRCRHTKEILTWTLIIEYLVVVTCVYI